MFPSSKIMYGPAIPRQSELSGAAYLIQLQQLGDCLGKGAFGSVFRALNMGTGETVAVKQVKLADLPKSELRVITVQLTFFET